MRTRLPVSLTSAASLALLFSLPNMAAEPSPCDREPHRQFDFWLGTWEVRDGAGKLAGHNSITSEQGGCVLIERWQSAAGHGGMSMNYYDPLSRRWKQNWVSPGVILEMSGTLQEGSLVLEGPLQYLDKKATTLLRGIWTALPDGRVRQHFIESKDGGKTWEEWFDGYYSKKADQLPPSAQTSQTAASPSL
jgi:hypothetical protein